VVSSRAAIVFTVVSGIGAASFLLFLPTITAFATIPSIITATYYPWAKKHDLFPQVILGICLAWGIMVGNASLSTRNWPWENSSALCLVAAYTFVIVIYDTIYAHQDIPDDLRLGLGSTAVLFRNCTKLALSALTACMAASLYYCGILAEMGFLFFVIGVGGSVVSVGLMLYEVRLDDPASCWKWFSMGFWTTMLSITGGLVSEYMMR
jgi:4-hydroxybenzoate polyprenyltransferase